MAALILDGEVTEADSVSDLGERVRALKLEDFAEVWLELGGESEPRMCVLVHAGEQGWLMYLREAGDAGFSSRNPEHEGNPGATLDFRLSNGQVDEYPAAWTYPVPKLKAALVELLETGQRPRTVRWYDDGEHAMVEP